MELDLTMTRNIFKNVFIFLIAFRFPKITPGYMFNACFWKVNDSKSLFCNSKTQYSAYQDQPKCIGKDISVTEMTLYTVQRCNSSAQCGTGIGCCNVSNETPQVQDKITHLKECKKETCLNINLTDLPDSGPYYHVLRIEYFCDADADKEAAGFPTAGYVVIPLVIVLVAIVIGLVWRYRKRLFGKQDGDSSITKTGDFGQSHMATINKPYDALFETKSTEVHPAYSEESNFDDYSEISTVENNIPTNLDTEYNVLNLKTRSVQSDPNYGILSARQVNPDAFYFLVQKQDNGTQGDPYNHIGQTYKVEGGNESTYNSAQFGAQGEHREEDTYNHIERHKQSPSHKHVAV